jgi:hypothetical protein
METATQNMLTSLGVSPAEIADEKNIEISCKDQLKLIFPGYRSRRILSEYGINHSQYLKELECIKQINNLPNHKFAELIVKELNDFKVTNKLPHPDLVIKQTEINRLRKLDEQSADYISIKEEMSKISKTKYRFASSIGIIGAIVAEEVIIQNFQLALSRCNLRKVTVDDLFVGDKHKLLSLHSLYCNGKNYNEFYNKFKINEINKNNKEYIEKMKKELKNVKTEEEINKFISNVKLIEEDDDDDIDTEETDELLTPSDFITYVSKICKGMMTEHIKNIGRPDITIIIKMERELKKVLSYICFDTLESIARAITAFAENSKGHTINSGDLIKILSIILATANSTNNDNLFKRITITLDSFDKIIAKRKEVAAFRADAKLSDEARIALEKKKKEDELEKERKKEIRARLKELEKNEIKQEKSTAQPGP